MNSVTLSTIQTSSNFFQTIFFFFNDTATTEIYTLSLHDALPILQRPPVPAGARAAAVDGAAPVAGDAWAGDAQPDRKSTRLNSSHANISYAVFCLKKKNNKGKHTQLLLCDCLVVHFIF